MKLEEFLLLRIAEDEQAALACTYPHWRSWIEGRDGYAGDDALFMNENEGDHVSDHDVYGWTKPEQDHAARHDPARILRECRAKRALIQEYVEANKFYAQNVRAPAGELYGLRTALQALASAYADHPDCPEEWKEFA